MDICWIIRFCKVTHLMARILPFLNPSDYNMISQIRAKSGTIIAIGLKRDLRLSGSSDLPAYPGFIVMKIAVCSLIWITSPSNAKDVNLSGWYSFRAFNIELIYWATTDSTSTSIRLNSSKHPHPPVYISPENILPNDL